MRNEFWHYGQYPTQLPENQRQPSDADRWSQLLEFYMHNDVSIMMDKIRMRQSVNRVDALKEIKRRIA